MAVYKCDECIELLDRDDHPPSEWFGGDLVCPPCFERISTCNVCNGVGDFGSAGRCFYCRGAGVHDAPVERDRIEALREDASGKDGE